MYNTPMDPTEAIGVLVMSFAILCAFFLPAIIAFARRLSNRWSILIVNMFLGITLIGWAIALAWSCSGTAKVRRGEQHAH